jgi:hypothetical protein
MPDIAQPAEQATSALQKFRRLRLKWRSEASRLWEAAVGIICAVALFLIAIEIHWAIHSLLDDHYLVILFRLAIAFLSGAALGLFIRRPFREQKNSPSSAQKETAEGGATRKGARRPGRKNVPRAGARDSARSG